MSRVLLDDIWSDTHAEVFKECNNSLINQVTWAHREVALRLCVCTDASDLTGYGVVTNVPPDDLSLPHDGQLKQPLGFLSGAFTGTQLRWSTLEKEVYEIVATVARMNWVL